MKCQRTRDADRFWFERVFASDAASLKKYQMVTLVDIIHRHTSLPKVFEGNLMFFTPTATYASRKVALDAKSVSSDASSGAGGASSSSGNGTMSILWLTSNFGISWRKVDADIMQISLAVRTLGWFALGIGSSVMAASDFVVATIVNGVAGLQHRCLCGSLHFMVVDDFTFFS